MKNHSKIGGKRGRPAYRTPSRFIANRSIEIARFRPNNSEKRGRM
ncbi:MAG: hypothetical protein AAB682_00785 [Patescibacteria group bacterium]